MIPYLHKPVVKTREHIFFAWIRFFWFLTWHLKCYSNIIASYFGAEEIALRTAEVAQLPPQVLAEEVICLDSTSSGSEDDSKGRLHSIKDGKDEW